MALGLLINKKEIIVGQTIDDASYHSNGFIRNVEFENCRFINVFDLALNASIVSFKNCVFDETVVLGKIKIQGNSTLIFENCTMQHSFQIDGAITINILNTTCEKRLSISKGGYVNLNIERGIDSKSEINELFVGSNNVATDAEFKNLICQKIEFSQNVAAKTRLWGGVYGKVLLNDVRNIKNLQIFGDESQLKNIIIDDLEMAYYNLDGSVLIKDADIKNWNISPFNLGDGKLRLQNVVFSGKVIATDSNLSNVIFNDIDFSRAEVYFDWSYLTETKFSNVIWPKGFLMRSVIQENTESNRLMRIRSLTEVYRQLKKQAISDSNNINALHFYRNEMASYWERVKIDKSETKWNRFLIRVDKIVSDFGQSYTRPLSILLVFTLSCFIGIWCFEYFFHGNSGDWDSTLGNGVVEYLRGLNPISKVPDYWHFAAKIIAYLMKVLNGFFIYHFIKATRKFGKI